MIVSDGIFSPARRRAAQAAVDRLLASGPHHVARPPAPTEPGNERRTLMIATCRGAGGGARGDRAGQDREDHHRHRDQLDIAW